MAVADQKLTGDGVYLQKNDRILTLTDKAKVKFDAIPKVVNNLETDDDTAALSASMGRIINDRLNELASVWNFLSVWDCKTWLPESDPINDPHKYAVWDYYIVGRTAAQNYKPYWSTYYARQASTTLDANPDLKVWDQYMYNGNEWNWIPSGWRAVIVDWELSTTSTNPVENRVITWVVNTLATSKALEDLSDIVDTKIDANLAATKAELNTLEWIVNTKAPISTTATKSELQALTQLVNKKADAWEMSADLEAKQDVIEDLSDIREWAEKWATALQPWDVKDAKITLKIWTMPRWDFTLNQADNEEIDLEECVYVTQEEYNALPASKLTDGKSYFITDAQWGTLSWVLKVFTLASITDVTTGQEIVDWYTIWWIPCVKFWWDNSLYYLSDKTDTYIAFSELYWKHSQWNSYDSLTKWFIKVNISGNKARSLVKWVDDWWHHLDAATDYSVPYMPEYDWSPATKKYADTRNIFITKEEYEAITPDVNATYFIYKEE